MSDDLMPVNVICLLHFKVMGWILVLSISVVLIRFFSFVDIIYC